MEVQFDASDSFSKRPIRSYSWDFGNGETRRGKTATASFVEAGSYTVQLTLTDSLGEMSALEKMVHIDPVNNPPLIPHNQRFTLEQGKISLIRLLPATDREDNPLTYGLVEGPSQGALEECLNGDTDLMCKYRAPSDFIGQTTFSYKANDGASDSLSSVKVVLKIVPQQPSILQLASFHNHNCVLFSNKKMKCWGQNNYGQLGLGHTNHIGDDETLLSQGFVNLGSNALQISLGLEHTCALLADKNIKCWGWGGQGLLGPGTEPIEPDPSLLEPLNVGIFCETNREW